MTCRGHVRAATRPARRRANPPSPIRPQAGESTFPDPQAGKSIFRVKQFHIIAVTAPAPCHPERSEAESKDLYVNMEKPGESTENVGISHNR